MSNIIAIKNNEIEIPVDKDEIFKAGKLFREMMMMFNCAIREVKTKLEVLNDEFSVRYSRNPIEFINSRIKKPESIYEKLQRKNLDISMYSIQHGLSDVAGIRVICSFVEDIYFVADSLIKQDDIKLVQVKDYIQNPKPNGYRSLHLIVEVPVFFSDRKEQMKVEVQIRTIAMDFWASIEHELKYKKEIKNQEWINKELLECANVISQTDYKMQNIYHKIQEKDE